MEPLRANSWSEAYLYLKVTPCTDCASGPWELDTPDDATGDGPRRLRAHCAHCGAAREFTFECDPTDADAAIEGLSLEPVNPSDEPSRIIDLGQWLSLFYTFVDSATKTADKGEARRLTFQAAQCLDEALKFYAPDDDLPPESAFFTDRSRQAFADHTGKFAREKLRLMRRKLPDLRLMTRRLARDADDDNTPRGKRWWQFWRSQNSPGPLK